jgi:hypothetical protein
MTLARVVQFICILKKPNELPEGSQNMNRAPVPKTTMRLPADVVTWLQQKAEYHISSMTCELTRVCRERMAEERRERMAHGRQLERAEG